MLVKVCTQTVKALPMSLQATAGVKRIIPMDSNEFRYLRFKAIGNLEISSFNGNWDGFPYEHFEDNRPGFGYKSFINRRAHFEHNSALGIAGSIGDLPDAYLNKLTYPDEYKNYKWTDLVLSKDLAPIRAQILQMPMQKDGSIEVLMRIDTKLVNSAKVKRDVKSALARLIRMIDTGQQLTCSMGTNVSYSVCSACGNEARFATDYCDHLSQFKKGGLTIVTANQIRDLLDREKLRPEWLKWICANKFDAKEILSGLSNKGIAVRNGEINHILSFFELSVVGTPAFPEAILLEKYAKQAQYTSDYAYYKQQIRKQLGDDLLLDLYSDLKQDGLISSSCGIS
jgi:hypothetical protein